MFPLSGVNPNDVTQGGFRFLDWTGDTYHPGIDFNTPGGPFSDRGAEVVACAAGIVRFVEVWDGSTKGFGTHVWVEHLGNVWTHYAHLGGAGVSPGLLIERGYPLGVCGGSGGWIDHLHFDVTRDRPPSWWVWPKHWPIAQVKALYVSPLAWIQEQDHLAELRRAEAVRAALEAEGVTTLAEMTEDQKRKVGQHLYGAAPFTLEHGIPQAYINALQLGRYLGAPSDGEADLGDSIYVQKFQKPGGEAVIVFTPDTGAFVAE
jgi:murein DD-endopeptidase MepM/ murein hydrolase activator NlpD